MDFLDQAAAARGEATEAEAGPVNRTGRTYKAGKCEPDPLDPDRVPCTNAVNHDDRQGVSHFFGRNKRATSAIPTWCYPLLCRTCYQTRKYRMKDTPGIEAGAQTDAIQITMERMSKVTWTDELGNSWPRWAGFELQLCRNPSVIVSAAAPADDDTDAMAVDTPKIPVKTNMVKFSQETKTQAEDDAKKKSRSTRIAAASGPVPEWLRNLCSRDHMEQGHSPIGERNGARYSFNQMATIVKHIKCYCIGNNTRLPAIEALPLSAGLDAEARIKAAKDEVRQPLRRYNVAEKELRKAQIASGDTARLKEQLAERGSELHEAKEKQRLAEEDLNVSKKTLPVRRELRNKEAVEQAEKDARGIAEKAEMEARIEAEKVKAKAKQPAVAPEAGGSAADNVEGDSDDEDTVVVTTKANTHAKGKGEAKAKPKPKLKLEVESDTDDETV